MAENTQNPVPIPLPVPKKFNVYDKATDRKLTATPISESQVEDFKRRLEESNKAGVTVKEVLLG